MFWSPFFKHYTDNMKDEKVSGNLDGPEGALEAMFQAITCRVNIFFLKNLNKIR